MSIQGDWDVTIKTPIGTLAVLYAFTELRGGLTGTATYRTKRLRCKTLRASRPRVVPGCGGDRGDQADAAESGL